MDINAFFTIKTVTPDTLQPYPKLLGYRLSAQESIILEFEAKLFLAKWLSYTPDLQAILATKLHSLAPEPGSRAQINKSVEDDDEESVIACGVRIVNVKPLGDETYRILIQETTF